MDRTMASYQSEGERKKRTAVVEPGPSKKQKQPSAGTATVQEQQLCCSLCNQVKSKDDFSKSQKRKGRRGTAKCKQCIAAEHNLSSPGGRAEKAQTVVTSEKKEFICGRCKTTKSNEEFHQKQSKKGRPTELRRCISCSEIENRERDEAEEELRLEDEREREEAAKLKRAAYEELQKVRAAYGPQLKNLPTFEVPGFGSPCYYNEEEDSDDSFGLFGYECPTLNFSRVEATLESLVGCYDLIFYNSFGAVDEYHENRATKGTMELTMNEHDGQLNGTVSLHKSVRVGIRGHEDDTRFLCKPMSENDRSDRLDFDVTNTEDISDCDGDEAAGHIQVVPERTAVRYMSEDPYPQNHERSYAKSIQFESVDEAQTILNRYYGNGGEPLKWISNHMKMPSEVAQLVRAFATSKPVPIFLFEKNDLWLTFDWESEFATALVARRRTSTST